MTKTIGIKIKEARKGLNYSQLKLAELCGWESQSRISNYEAGTREPTLYDLKIISRALKIDILDLISDEVKDPVQSNPNLELPLYSWESLEELSDAPPIRYIRDLAPPGSYALEIKDDIMFSINQTDPVFKIGNIIIIRPEAKADINKFTIIKHTPTGKILFRKYVDLGLTRKFVPLNPMYDACEECEAEILGVVVASMNLDL